MIRSTSRSEVEEVESEGEREGGIFEEERWFDLEDRREAKSEFSERGSGPAKRFRPRRV